MTYLILTVSLVAAILSLGDPRVLLRGAHPFTVVWVFLLVGWPFVVVFLIAPLLWGSVEHAGQLYPALSFVPAALCSLITFFGSVRRGQFDVHLPSAVIGTLYVFGFASVWAYGFADLNNFVFAVGMYAGLLLRRGPTSLKTLSAGVLLSIVAVALSVCASVLLGSSALAQCRTDKCAATAGQVITSPFVSNANFLGLGIACVVPVACAVLPLWRSLTVVIAASGILVLAGSRTAMLGLSVVAVAVVLIKIAKTDRWQMVTGTLALVVGFCASVYPLFVTFTGSSFAGRGYIWQAGREAISQAPIFGHGPGYWAALARDAIFDPNYSPHNGWYDVMVSVGAWGVLVILVGVAVQIATTARAAVPYLLTFYGGILSLNTFESIFVPYWLGILPFASLLPLMVYEPKKSGDLELTENLALVHAVGEPDAVPPREDRSRVLDGGQPK